jgi:hypothetical protein
MQLCDENVVTAESVPGEATTVVSQTPWELIKESKQTPIVWRCLWESLHKMNRPLEAISKPKVVHARVLEHGRKQLAGSHDRMISQARILSGTLCHREFHRVDGESRNPTSKDARFFRCLAGCRGVRNNLFSACQDLILDPDMPTSIESS